VGILKLERGFVKIYTKKYYDLNMGIFETIQANNFDEWILIGGFVEAYPFDNEVVELRVYKQEEFDEEENDGGLSSIGNLTYRLDSETQYVEDSLEPDWKITCYVTLQQYHELYEKYGFPYKHISHISDLINELSRRGLIIEEG
jgi:hypothetical protein